MKLGFCSGQNLACRAFGLNWFSIGPKLVKIGLWSGRNWSSFGLNWFMEWSKLVSIWFGNGAKLAFWYDQNWLAFGLKLFWKRLKLVCFWNGWNWWTFSLNWCWSWIRLWVKMGSKLNVWMVKIRSKKMVQKLTKNWLKFGWNWTWTLEIGLKNEIQRNKRSKLTLSRAKNWMLNQSKEKPSRNWPPKFGWNQTKLILESETAALRLS